MRYVLIYALDQTTTWIRTPNQSHASSNRVSLIETRISKIRDQRLAQEFGVTPPEIEEKSSSDSRPPATAVSIASANNSNDHAAIPGEPGAKFQSP